MAAIAFVMLILPACLITFLVMTIAWAVGIQLNGYVTFIAALLFVIWLNGR